MLPRSLAASLVLPALFILAACGGHSGNPYSLTVGSDDGGERFAPGEEDGGTGAFDAHIERDHVAVSFVTLTCDGPCADVVAVPTGGRAPYTFAWEDGSTSAARHVCPKSDTKYRVDVTDSATSGELAIPAETVRVPLTADVVACPDAGAAGVYWTTWTAMRAGAPGTAAGHVSPPSGDIEVTYDGEVNASSAPTGTTITTALGAVTFAPASTFVSATVAVPPPPTGMIALDGSAMLKQTVTFSAPVKDPLLAVFSLGDATVLSRMVLTFDETPELLSSGPETVGSTTITSGSLTVSGDVLSGAEGTGVVQIPGTFRAIHFTSTTPEVGGLGYLTIGVRGPG